MEKLSCGSDVVETNFGTRALNKQNNNTTIVVPRICLENIGSSLDKLKVSLVQGTNGKKFITLESPDSEIESKDMENNEDE